MQAHRIKMAKVVEYTYMYIYVGSYMYASNTECFKVDELLLYKQYKEFDLSKTTIVSFTLMFCK